MSKEDSKRHPSFSSTISDSSEADEDETKDMGQYTKNLLATKGEMHNNLYIFQNRNSFLFFASIIMVGGYYSFYFQGFVKDQLISSMEFTNGQYQSLVTIPFLPNIVLPIIAGPLLDIIGIRTGILFFSIMILIGMAFTLISTSDNSFTLMLLGKILLVAGAENLQLTQSTLISKWFRYSSIALAMALCSLIVKISSSLSGVGYSYLFEASGSMTLPLSIGLTVCFGSLLAAVIVIYMDKKSEVYEILSVKEENEMSVKKREKFNIKDIKHFGIIYWLVVLQIFMLWGMLVGFQNYGQAILINKFSLNQIEASSSLAILYFVGISSPLFGILSDKYGKRGHAMIFIACMNFIAFLMIMASPSTTEETSGTKLIVYLFLFMFGTSISLGNAYIFPSIPLIVDANLVGTAYGICYAARNLGSFFFSLLGGFIIGNEDQRCNQFLLFFFIFFILQIIVSILTMHLDRQSGDRLLPPKLITNSKESTITTEVL